MVGERTPVLVAILRGSKFKPMFLASFESGLVSCFSLLASG